MLLAITESNSWERERWTYIFDTSLQDAAVINELALFCEMANKESNKIKDKVMTDPDHPWVTDMFGRQLYKLFATSFYRMRFYDSYEVNEEHGYPILIEGTRKTHMNSQTNYKDAGLMLDRRISPSRLHSAIVTMRGKQQNKLYKNFESVLLKDKRRNR